MLATMFRLSSLSACAALALATPASFPALAQQNAAAAQDSAPYAEVADLVLQAPLVIDVTVRSAARIKGQEAAGVAANAARFYVEADVGALIRGSGAMPARIGYLVDVPLDFRGRAPNLKKARVLIFARPVAGRPDQVQLVQLDAQRSWSPALDQRVRGVVREVLDPAAPPAITGIGNAFHVVGTLPGEGETQIFLKTETGDPVSLLVLRRPNQPQRWAVSFGDIVNEDAGPPQPDTLGWYRLACGLPRRLPASALETQEGDNARLASEDYQFVLRALGPCRTAPAPAF
ncbi:hypothetical protein LK533_01200 [Sphingomonas sp. PL-96]|uniref:hypothetical protein n=1 Tax=Sphingomonas sp. PL-96 TaxID=2887201 RepID=UPI001E61B6E8|nr:hypothetical protein [Sphingomonas sp. PL-96]MCC2975287.1 hypothetical protein [Sphingomonas sp. PL-96]